jgi:hypothetical protein
MYVIKQELIISTCDPLSTSSNERMNMGIVTAVITHIHHHG